MMGKNDIKGTAINFFIAALAISLGAFWSGFDVLNLVSDTLGTWLGYFIAVALGVLIVWGVAKLLGGKAKYSTHYNAGSYLTLATVPMIIPGIGQILGGLLSLWAIVMHVFLIKEIHKLSMGKAVLAIVIPYAIILVLVFFLVALAGMAFLGLLTGVALS